MSQIDLGNGHPPIPMPEGSMVADGTEHTTFVPVQEGATEGLNQIGDTIEFERNLGGNVTIKGTITYYEEGVQTTYSLVPTDPSLPVPQGGASEGLASNEWFNVSFTAVFSTIMDEVLASMRKTRYLEAMVELQSRSMTLELAKNSAQLAIILSELKASQTLMDAISGILSAGIAFATLGQYAAMNKKVNDHPDVKQAKTELDQAELSFNQRAANDVGGKPLDPAVTLKQYQDNPQDYPHLKASHDNYAAAKTNYDQTRNHVRSTVRETINMQNQAYEGINRAITNIAKAMFQTEEGIAEAAKQMIEGYMNVMRTFTENSGRHRDDAGAAFNEAVRLLMQIVDSIFRAFQLGRS